MSQTRTLAVLGGLVLAASALSGLWLMRRTTEDLPRPGSRNDDRLPVAELHPAWKLALDAKADALRACGASGAITIDLSFAKDGSLHQVRPHPASLEPPWSACASEVLAKVRLDPAPRVPLVTRYRYAL